MLYYAYKVSPLRNWILTLGVASIPTSRGDLLSCRAFFRYINREDRWKGVGAVITPEKQALAPEIVTPKNLKAAYMRYLDVIAGNLLAQGGYGEIRIEFEA